MNEGLRSFSQALIPTSPVSGIVGRMRDMTHESALHCILEHLQFWREVFKGCLCWPGDPGLPGTMLGEFEVVANRGNSPVKRDLVLGNYRVPIQGPERVHYTNVPS